MVDESHSESLPAMYARRRTFKRSQYRSVPAPHSGLGLSAYAQATSPMRRYLDLVVHQQLRAYLANKPLLTPEQILERVGAVEAVLPSTRPAEQYSERHWILVYLLQHPDWRGRGVLVDKRSHNSTVIIPELGLEPPMRLPADLPLGSELTLSLRSVDLPRLDARFRVDDHRLTTGTASPSTIAASVVIVTSSSSMSSFVQEPPMTYFFDPESRTGKELVPGVVVRTFWGEQMLASLVDLAAGAVIPAHSHPHEQFGMLLRGEMEITIGGETRTVKPATFTSCLAASSTAYAWALPAPRPSRRSARCARNTSSRTESGRQETGTEIRQLAGMRQRVKRTVFDACPGIW